MASQSAASFVQVAVLAARLGGCGDLEIKYGRHDQGLQHEKAAGPTPRCKEMEKVRFERSRPVLKAFLSPPLATSV